MSNTTTGKLTGIACLLTGTLVGVAGAEIAGRFQGVRFVQSGLFLTTASERGNFNVTLVDQEDGPPARIALRMFNGAGSVVTHTEVTLRPGQTSTLRFPGGDALRAQAEILESEWPLTETRTLKGTLDVIDTVKPQIRTICSIDPTGVPGGRDSIPGQ